MKRRTPTSGFTIVELLIVIVVIGILASLVLSSFSTVQSKARSQQNISIAAAYGKALALYLTDNGHYPPSMTSGPYQYFCVGTPSNDVNGDGLLDCSTMGTVSDVWQNTTFNNEMQPYVNHSAVPASTAITSADNKRLTGVQIWYDYEFYVDGIPHPWVMYYIVEDTDTCQYGNLLSDDGWPYFSSTEPPSGYTWQENGGRACMIALPKP